MANLQAWWTNFSAYMATLTTQEGKLNSWQYLAMLVGVLCFFLLLLLILYVIKSGQCNRERKIKEKISKTTSAIIPVHVFGNACDVEKIDEIAKKFNLNESYPPNSFKKEWL